MCVIYNNNNNNNNNNNIRVSTQEKSCPHKFLVQLALMHYKTQLVSEVDYMYWPRNASTVYSYVTEGAQDRFLQ